MAPHQRMPYVFLFDLQDLHRVSRVHRRAAPDVVEELQQGGWGQGRGQPHAAEVVGHGEEGGVGEGADGCGW